MSADRLNALVTGASDGIGRETARQLLDRGFRLFVHGRNEQRARQTAYSLAADEEWATPVWGDFSRLTEVVSLAEQVATCATQLDVLINNAGIYASERSLSADGHEMTMAVNYLAPFVLTHHLLEPLQRAPEPRIVNVSSMTHTGGTLDLRDLNLERRWDAYGAYATSKLANVLFSNQLAKQHARGPLVSNALHPGVIGTKLLRAGFGMGGGSVADGAATSVYLAASTEVAGISGEYFVNCRRERASARARDSKLAAKLWEETAHLVRDYL